MNTEVVYQLVCIAIIVALIVASPYMPTRPDGPPEPAPDLDDLLRRAAADRWITGNEMPMTREDQMLEEAAEAGLLRARPEGGASSIVRFEITNAGRAMIGLPPVATMTDRLRGFSRRTA